MRLFKSEEQKRQLESGRSRYDEFVAAVASADPTEARRLAVAFKGDADVLALSDKEQRKRAADAFRTYAENLLADDILSIDEEMAFQDVGDALGVDQGALESTFRDVLLRLAVARLNDGRLPLVEQPHLMVKRNEVVHQEAGAALMKEVVRREWRSGSSGVSFRVAKGVRYRVGRCGAGSAGYGLGTRRRGKPAARSSGL
jgi:hypothetical protein